MPEEGQRIARLRNPIVAIERRGERLDRCGGYGIGARLSAADPILDVQSASNREL
jgi:hypothetical protein